jgi:hypothetical protein
MRLTIFLFFSLGFFYATCQIEEPKFGKIPKELLDFNYLEIDSSASAVKLFDFGASTISYVQNMGWQVEYKRHIAIKIISKDGYDWANHEVLLYKESGNQETISQIKGLSYNRNEGKYEKTKLEKSSIFFEDTNEFWDKAKIAMPNVKEGSIIELQYRITSEINFNLRSWEFQSSIPTVYSEYVTRIPEFFTYKRIPQGYHSFAVNKVDQRIKEVLFQNVERVDKLGMGGGISNQRATYQEKIAQMGAVNIPAMNDETFVSSLSNYIQKIDFELQFIHFPGSEAKDYRGSWSVLNKSFLENEQFGKQLDNVRFISEELEKLKSEYTEKESLLAAAYDFVRSSMSWDGFRSRYVDNTLRSAYMNQSGNSADINILMTAVLRALGFESYPVLISTRGNGLVKTNFPSSGQFDYVISYVKFGEKHLLLDATNRNVPLGFLPEKCINDKGFVISESEGFWVDLKPTAGYKINHKLSMDISTGDLFGNVVTEYSNYASFDLAGQFNSDGNESLSQNFEDRYPDWVIDNYQGEIKPGYQYVENIKLSIPDAVENIGDLFLINSVLIGDVQSNPFKLEERKYPIDFTYPRTISYKLTMTIPENYQVDELPQATNVMLPARGGRFLYNASAQGNRITIMSLFEIKNQVYLPEMYPYLKEFYKMVVEKHAEKIVLKKS